MGVPLNIDWQQILLHLFNFIILAGGLYLLLYSPVKAFMAKRQQYYADMNKKAEEYKNSALSEKQKYEEQLKNAENEIAEMKKTAIEIAEKTKNAYIEEAKQEKQKILANVQNEAILEKQRILANANKDIESMLATAVDKLIHNTDPLNEFLNKAEKED